ncbi:NAD(P)/FAD-dependent oxidoreductase [Paenibacillus sp. JNUCC31]|uniref:nitrite reductase large subunit NirB n=1 Tax=Paenibacillus sp. JNUCC-31 TaxID=2777983 RepID=UPI00177BEBBC|nr:nitrite reductase large subunit NirB [Paenibacillus sp. JNUCC-31]QOS76980.1 NAD(P)/FAD-dependent oxidoreductase [Paenibacillus sp. JNUCC-31]
MSKKKLVIIGNGMAGVKCVEEIIALEPDSYEIVIYGNEPRPNYNRIMLSKVLQGEHSLQDIIINDWNWYKEHGIRLCTGEMVHRINTQANYIETESGIRETYDILILATGSSPFVPPIPGIDKERVMSFRTIDDCTRMSEYSKEYRKAAVIGGGLLGLEAARGLLHLGMEAVVVHNAPYIMNRQLDLKAASMLQQELEAQGMTFLLAKNTQKIIGRSQAQGLLFTDGSKLEAQVVVVAVGIRPNVDLARRSGIATNRAIVVDDYMRTSVPGIYAVGECAEHRGISYGLVAPLYEQGKVLARTLCGQDTPEYKGSIPYSQLKVSGVDVFSAGEISGEGLQTAIQTLDGIRGTYKKVLMKAGKVRGAILFGDTAEGTALLGLVQRGAEVAELAPREDAPDPAEMAAAALPDQETVCACNNVTKAVIMKAIQEQGLQTADQVREQTKASGSCGGCRPMVAALVKHTHNQKNNGGAGTVTQLEEKSVMPVCSCTDLSHAGLKESLDHILREEHMDILHHQPVITRQIDITLILQKLDWATEQGCTVCRPSIHYYLQVSTSTMNERVTIADEHPAAGRGGMQQQFMEAGIKRKHEIQIRWDDGIPLSSYTLDVGDLAAKLCSSWTDAHMPSPVNVGIAPRPGSLVSALVQDLGLLASPVGWEIYAGGHAEHPVKEGRLLGVAETELQAALLATACLQWYRQTAWYDEPLWAWTERLGFMAIRETLLDDQFQKELAMGIIAERQGWGNEITREFRTDSFKASCKGDSMSVLQCAMQNDS